MQKSKKKHPFGPIWPDRPYYYTISYVFWNSSGVPNHTWLVRFCRKHPRGCFRSKITKTHTKVWPRKTQISTYDQNSSKWPKWPFWAFKVSFLASQARNDQKDIWICDEIVPWKGTISGLTLRAKKGSKKEGQKSVKNFDEKKLKKRHFSKKLKNTHFGNLGVLRGPQKGWHALVKVR